MPWSTALRMMWVSGSRIISIISRSSSTSPPSMSTSTCLPSSAERSRTMRGSPTNRFSIRCMRVRVIASRMSAMIAERRSNAPSTGDVGRTFAQPTGKLVAREHHVGDGAHHAVEQLDREADRARAPRLVRDCPSATGAATGAAGPSAPGSSACNQRAVVTRRASPRRLRSPRSSRRCGR